MGSNCKRRPRIWNASYKCPSKDVSFGLSSIILSAHALRKAEGRRIPIMLYVRSIIAMAIVLICCDAGVAIEQHVVVKPSTFLSTLEHRHPRLMLKDKDLVRLKELYAKDEVLQRYLTDVLSKADVYAQKPVLTYEKIGPRLLRVSRECLKRIYALGLAWRWTGKAKYADKAAQNLLAVCAFKDWNPSHFLDTAEMSHAVGVGTRSVTVG